MKTTFLIMDAAAGVIAFAIIAYVTVWVVVLVIYMWPCVGTCQ